MQGEKNILVTSRYGGRYRLVKQHCMSPPCLLMPSMFRVLSVGKVEMKKESEN